MKYEQFQLPMSCTPDRKTTQIWWLTNMKYKHSKLLLLLLCPHECKSLIICKQVVCPNVLKCQLTVMNLVLENPHSGCKSHRLLQWSFVS